MEQWLRQRLKAGVGYDQLVRELLTQPTSGNPGLPCPRRPGRRLLGRILPGQRVPARTRPSTARLFLGGR